MATVTFHTLTEDKKHPVSSVDALSVNKLGERWFIQTIREDGEQSVVVPLDTVARIVIDGALKQLAPSASDEPLPPPPPGDHPHPH